MRTCRVLRAFVASGLCFAFFCALALAATPQLHERLHADAGLPNHECVVTLIAHGECAQGGAPVVFMASQPTLLAEKLLALHSVWVAAPFLGAGIFAHAPPLFA